MDKAITYLKKGRKVLLKHAHEPGYLSKKSQWDGMYHLACIVEGYDSNNKRCKVLWKRAGRSKVEIYSLSSPNQVMTLDESKLKSTPVQIEDDFNGQIYYDAKIVDLCLDTSNPSQGKGEVLIRWDRGDEQYVCVSQVSVGCKHPRGKRPRTTAAAVTNLPVKKKRNTPEGSELKSPPEGLLGASVTSGGHSSEGTSAVNSLLLKSSSDDISSSSSVISGESKGDDRKESNATRKLRKPFKTENKQVFNDGTQVVKKFCVGKGSSSRLFSGTVVGFEPKTYKYKIKYSDDGYTEKIGEQELSDIAIKIGKDGSMDKCFVCNGGGGEFWRAYTFVLAVLCYRYLLLPIVHNVYYHINKSLFCVTRRDATRHITPLVWVWMSVLYHALGIVPFATNQPS